MISSNDFRPGVTIEIDNQVWQVVDFQHVKPGKGAAFVRAKIKNLQTGAVIERTFNAGEKLPKAQVDRRPMQYLYADGDSFHFMDTETYDQVMLTKDQLTEALNFLKENMEITVLFFNGTIIGVELPNSVDLTVVETDPGIRGDTATGGTKPAKLETGYVVKVPMFINEGDVLRIDTRSGAYIERA
ncbi:MAG: elongation factor P [Negativicoccus massiliensis]|uniref:elongation factor P n=1 Tax=Negativicoccus succinicivorans TaxID=620903 RepID=UPI00050E4B07|nr:elongation factor P [Negativicoccus succinicivorans]KGF12581.1 elongation factor P [Tissierellia bacterium S5-A11]MDU4641854.1 elongation factor P [Negativicoccus massiliensis]MBS5887025.1 elongation factor P [Negativicoccus succinicivorans]MDU2417443.1 elongation factor P [Negativicoccus succinicivorans]MDU3214339.1 elongation factor P [Negativicoccus succinicivorans]